MREYNFSAGPAMIPTPVLEQAQSELLEWNKSGMSIMEHSHRARHFMEMAHNAEACLRRLMGIDNNYAVLFLQGGARLQFASVPMNLTAQSKVANYVDTGYWSHKAINEAKRFAQVVQVAPTNEDVLHPERWQWSDGAAYFHYTPNETIDGWAYPFIPTPPDDIPVVADMSSCILSRTFDVNSFGVIYASAQKNIGPAGLTIVIVRRSLLQYAVEGIPRGMHYQSYAQNQSLFNTPPTFAWYLSGLVFQWLEEQGGVESIEKINYHKSQKLYDFIDRSDMYVNTVPVSCRSIVNVVFSLADETLNEKFLQQAKENGLHYLRGHRDLGGMRASIYNAMPEEGVDALISFMIEFSRLA